MSNRTKDDMNLTVKGMPFIGMWWSGTETGVSFGMKTGLSRNVHLTIFLRDNILNAHITDTAKTPRKVWEMELPISELEPIGKGFMTSMFKRYYWHQRYYQVSPDLLEAIGITPNSMQQPKRNYDVVTYIKGFLTEDALVKKRIRKGVNEGFRPGFIFKGENAYFVCPLDKTKMFIVNTDIEKTPLWKLPTVQGFFRFIDYLDEEQIFEEFARLNEKKMEQIKVTLLGVLAEEGIEVEEDL